MKIILSPIAAFQQDVPPTVSGEKLTYRGQTHDLGQLPDGAVVQAVSPFIGQIARVNGQIQLKLEYCYHMEKAEDHQSLYWEDYTFNVAEGQCPDPIRYKPVPQSDGVFEA